jgi:hypothetical protein
MLVEMLRHRALRAVATTPDSPAFNLGQRAIPLLITNRFHLAQQQGGLPELAAFLMLHPGTRIFPSTQLSTKASGKRPASLLPNAGSLQLVDRDGSVARHLRVPASDTAGRTLTLNIVCRGIAYERCMVCTCLLRLCLQFWLDVASQEAVCGVLGRL